MQYTTKMPSFNVGFSRILKNIKILSVDSGIMKGLFTVSKNEADEHGKLHKGFSATAVDVTTSLSLQSLLNKGTNFVSAEMNFSFIESAKIGDEILIEAKTLSKGRRLVFVEAELRNKQTNNLLVKGSQVLYLLNR